MARFSGPAAKTPINMTEDVKNIAINCGRVVFCLKREERPGYSLEEFREQIIATCAKVILSFKGRVRRCIIKGDWKEYSMQNAGQAGEG
jgi:hypothetical protein